MLPDLFSAGAMTGGSVCPAHNFWSATHEDIEHTDTPVDGDVATFDATLNRWLAKAPSGGVTDHGFLTGLSDDDHSIYALLAGRNGGQTLKGSLLASEHLTLQSTAHATRGYVRSQDDFQLLSGCLRDSGGSQRIKLAIASPHLTLTGQVKITGETAIGGGAPETNKGLIIAPSPVPQAGSWTGIFGSPQVSIPSGNPSGSLFGLSFVIAMTGGGNSAVLDYARALNVGINTLSLTATITEAVLAYLAGPLLYFGTPSVSTWKALYAGPVVSNKIVNAYGAHIEDITNNTGFTRLLELGPTVPYLRVVGGAAPAAGLSNMYLNIGGTLYRVRTRTVNGYTGLTID
jgi:hypothetical protein